MKLYKLTCQALKQINDTRNARAASKLPDFIIVGAQKCGTSTLHYSLSKHPNIFMSNPKELDFFDNDDNFKLGIEWYASFFEKCPLDSIAGEASPEYFHCEQAAYRMAKLLPKVKIIILLRNPVDRAYSGYWHSVRIASETLPFNRAIKIEAERIVNNPYGMKFYSYISRGLYFKQIKTYFDLFGRSKIFIIISEEYFSNPAGTLKKISEFLGVNCDKRFLDSVRMDIKNEGRTMRSEKLQRLYKQLRKGQKQIPFFATVINRINKKREKYPTMDKETKRNLEKYFAESNQELDKLLRRDLSIWRNNSNI